MRKSFKLAPGVRMTVSKSGVSYSAGGKGYRVTKTARGGVRQTVGLPGTGLSHSSTVTRGSSRTSRGSGQPRRVASGPAVAAPKPKRPGLFAPSGEKALHAEVFGKRRADAIEQIGNSRADYRAFAFAVAGLLAYAGQDYQRAERCLAFAFQDGIEPTDHSFFKKYMGGTEVSLEIAPGVTAELPMNREAVGLALAEIGQGTGRLNLAIDTVEQLEPTYTAAISLAELYSDAGRHDEVIKLTDGMTNQDDQAAFLITLRGVAFREMGLRDASREAFKEALKRRSAASAIRHRALLERAALNINEGKKALARKDLERVIAEDSLYPGVQDLLRTIE